MRKKSEPDDVDLFVGGVAPDADASRETARFISEYKSRPDYLSEVEEAEETLSSLGLRPSDYGMADAESLLTHWRACVADLTKPTAAPAKTK